MEILKRNPHLTEMSTEGFQLEGDGSSYSDEDDEEEEEDSDMIDSPPDGEAGTETETAAK